MRPIEFQILLALAAEERHGYAIIQDIEARAGDGTTVETGTLYRALQRLVEQNFVRPSVTARREPGEDERRRYYMITAAGKRAAADEAHRMSALVDQARSARLLSGGH